LNGVFEQIHLLTKKYLKYQNTKYSICSISNTKYKKYFKYVFEIQVFQIPPPASGDRGGGGSDLLQNSVT